MASLHRFTTFKDLYYQIIHMDDHKRFLNLRKGDAWVPFSISEYRDTVCYLTLGLKQMGIRHGTTVGIIADSSPWWVMIDHAIILAGGVTVPLFSNLSSENLHFEIDDAKVKHLFVASNEKFTALEPFLEDFNTIITYHIDRCGARCTELNTLIEIGRSYHGKAPSAFENLLLALKPSDLASIVYTSGSTGVPKGVELTHENLLVQLEDISESFDVNCSDVVLSFLPLAHIYERTVMNYYLSAGASIYFADDVKQVGDLAKTLHPTLMTVVPRLLEKVYGKMRLRAEEAGGLKSLLARIAFHRAMGKDPQTPKGVVDRLLERLVYHKLTAALGGEIRYLVSGGAALSPSLHRFFENIGVRIYQGYGLSEASPVICANTPAHHKIGTCGPAFRHVEIKLSEEGELLARGKSIMGGYHNAPHKSAEAIDKEGWLHTGDLASIDEDGMVQITGRKKELFKTSTGKYVTPTPIEQRLNLLKYVDFSMVVAEGRPYVIAVLFIDPLFIESMQGRLTSHQDPEVYVKSDAFRRYLLKRIKRINLHLSQWEQIRDVVVTTRTPSIEAGELTPSMKLNRTRIETAYKSEIDALY